MPRTSAINLLPKTEFEISFWGRFLKWALTAGRYIIILTEMIVIMAFLSRFKLDKDLLDLSDSISGKKNILEATYQIEVNFRSVQSRINLAKSILDISPNSTDLLGKLTTTVPSGLSLDSISLSMSDHTVALSASAISEQQLEQYLSALSADKTWKSVDVQDVSAAGNNVKFSINLGF